MEFNSGTSLTTIGYYINTYGKTSMIFSYAITGLGWFHCQLIFASVNHGGGYLVQNGTNRLWAVSYANNEVTLAEK